MPRLSEYPWPETWVYQGHPYGRQWPAPRLEQGCWAIPYGTAQCPVHADPHGLYALIQWPADDDVAEPCDAAMAEKFAEVGATMARVLVNHGDYTGP